MSNATITTALHLVNGAIIEAGAGPEPVSAVDPATASVNWDAILAPARDDKMRVIRLAVRGCLRCAAVLHQLPQILLVADDGACIELFGGSRTGTIDDVTPGSPEERI